MTSPIDAARARLAAALLAGEDSAPYRAAVAQLEAGARAVEERRAADAVFVREQRALDIQKRTDWIAGETQARIDALIAQHPVPTAEIAELSCAQQVARSRLAQQGTDR